MWFQTLPDPDSEFGFEVGINSLEKMPFGSLQDPIRYNDVLDILHLYNHVFPLAYPLLTNYFLLINYNLQLGATKTNSQSEKCKQSLIMLSKRSVSVQIRILTNPIYSVSYPLL